MSTAELDGLIGLLVSPGVLPIIRALAVAGRRGCRDLGAAIDPPLDDHTLHTALGRLAESGLVVIGYTDQAPNQNVRVDCTLTVSGQDLLAPLAGFATWYRYNHDQLAPDQPAAEPAGLTMVPVDAARERPEAGTGGRASHGERHDVEPTSPPRPPRAPAS